MQKFFAVLILGLIILVGSYFYLASKRQSATNNLIGGNIASDIENKINPSPTPLAFEELTIPFLRKKTFSSKLSSLEEVSENGSYASYLTSYTSENIKINGLLTQPTGEKPEDGWPAIIFIHGYIPPADYQTLTRYTDHIDFLARNNFVVFKIDLRGHGNSEGEPGGGYYSSDYVIDSLNAYAALQSSDFVNPKKIGFWGHSMAGNVVSRSIAAKPEIPAAAIWAGAGFSYNDLAEFGIQDSSYRPLPSDSERQRKRTQLRQTYGDPKDGNPFWKLVAATSYLNDLEGAVGLFHAVDDPTVSIEYSRNFSNLLDKTKVPHQLHEYPSGGHNISGASFTQAMQETVEFFNKYLGS